MKKLIAALVLVLLIAAGAFWFLFTGASVDDAKEMVQKVNPFARNSVILALEKKAIVGDLDAQLKLAHAYASGEVKGGVNHKKALEWYYKAAQQGNVKAQVAIGQMYEKGLGIGQDHFRAAEWFRVAAGPGKDADAQFSLGQMYASGRGVPNDYDKAVHFYRLAADQGHPAAQFLMGAMYGEGWGVKKNPVEAYKWFLLAMDNEEAVIAVNKKYNPTARRNALAAKMNRSQIEEADAAAEAWRRAHKR